jgi:Pathogenicity locus
MNPAKVVRNKVRRFSDLPNIGPASAKDFELLGFKKPGDLKGADPLDLYNALCSITGTYQDPCVLDVLMSVVDFLDGNPPRVWWHFTEQRKQRYGNLRVENNARADS